MPAGYARHLDAAVPALRERHTGTNERCQKGGLSFCISAWSLRQARDLADARGVRAEVAPMSPVGKPPIARAATMHCRVRRISEHRTRGAR